MHGIGQLACQGQLATIKNLISYTPVLIVCSARKAKIFIAVVHILQLVQVV